MHEWLVAKKCSCSGGLATSTIHDATPNAARPTESPNFVWCNTPNILGPFTFLFLRIMFFRHDLECLDGANEVRVFFGLEKDEIEDLAQKLT